jgi:tetratricopeptide (TPR) repeat protein
MTSGDNTTRYCRCGARLARHNPSPVCAPCQHGDRARAGSGPEVPPGFWDNDRLQDALRARHMGRVVAAYRLHPWHGKPISQRTAATWAGVNQAQLSRLETGLALQDLTRLVQWAQILHIPARLLWFALPATPSEPSPAARPAPAPQVDDVTTRRELLRLVGMTGMLLAVPGAAELDTERLAHAATRPSTVDSATVTQYETLNARLWQTYSGARTKNLALPAVRGQLDILHNTLRHNHTEAIRRNLNAVASDLFQLCGEIFFDGNRYDEAGQCYSHAATVARNADNYDLWACAMTRHAFLEVYAREFADATPILDHAAALARRGDTALTTRHWVAAVQAQAHAGLGDHTACERALASADDVTQINDPLPSRGWLRFEGSRLSEERGGCYVELGDTDRAETTLTPLLDQRLSPRRRGSLLTDLATIAAQRGDTTQLVSHGYAALDAARQTSSTGYLGRKLTTLAAHIQPFTGDTHVRNLHQRITDLTPTA